MSIEELNNAAASLGGTWVKLRSISDGPFVGTIVDFEQRDKSFEGAPVLNRKTGKPRIEWLFTLTVTPDGADDDGTRKLACNESMQRAIAKAIKDSGRKAEAGGILKIKVVTDPPSDREQAEYLASYEPPVLNVPTDGADPFAAATNAAAEPF